MTAPARRPEAQARVPLLVAFTARAEARAMLWQAGEIDLHDAVDELRASALRAGLVKWLGGDAIKQITISTFMSILGGAAGHA